MGALGRTDVWPVGDYGVRAGFARAWGLSDIPGPRELMELGEPFRQFADVMVVDERQRGDRRNALLHPRADDLRPNEVAEQLGALDAACFDQPVQI